MSNQAKPQRPPLRASVPPSRRDCYPRNSVDARPEKDGRISVTSINVANREQTVLLDTETAARLICRLAAAIGVVAARNKLQ